MGKGLRALAAALLAATGLAACSDGAGGERTPKIGVILPDSATSNRWEQADRKFLKEAFDAAGVQSDIQNAQGDKSQFQTIADQMITNGATVLMIVNLDSGTGRAVLRNARAKGVATIDYDRLTLDGGAQYYVSFDNVGVGRLMGQGLIRCLTDMGTTRPVVATLNGSETDNNSTLFKAGYDGELQKKYDTREYVKGPDQWVPDWVNAQAGTMFEQMMTETGGKIDGVLAANDGLANAVIQVLRRQGLNGKVPVTGQDADVEGLQNILSGDQCMTVYKDIKQEASAAADLAIALARGETRPAPATVRDTVSGREVPSVLLQPRAIYRDNVDDVVTAGYVTAEELCTGNFAKLCADNGVG
ncbi:sugar ABC transporter substrate-binding protein [Spirilliplanes yamanashiensis]|uniref:Sugar ABC transporter substrate-binding protein n=1 Tax=Spirilliplanes yamanashiensis TaxID=42233 RepID=A0A8J4DKL9_9ACTN|nr:substrate-binding domain-containing protein [Spirilliplanes yamanashiensis]MDP9815944.1 D-xylose transport system substrate-binding protein [Spirilliplanes yamanashiensis]GIJ04200.1 sugar ABC transporter substrate-binding protein [Spirilliplanes yamanashiensis]